MIFHFGIQIFQEGYKFWGTNFGVQILGYKFLMLVHKFPGGVTYISERGIIFLKGYKFPKRIQISQKGSTYLFV